MGKRARKRLGNDLIWGQRKSTTTPARQTILEAVNEYLDERYQAGVGLDRHLDMRHINEAVCIARRQKLVEPELFSYAGFNSSKSA